MMMVMSNRPDSRPPLLLLVMSGLVVSINLSSTAVPHTQNMTTSRFSQEHSTAAQPASGPGVFTSNTGTERYGTNATGSESPLPTSTGPALMLLTSVGPKEGTQKQATNSSTAIVSVAPTSHGPPTNTTQLPSSHVSEKGASATLKPESTKPQSTQSIQTPGKTTTSTTTSGGNKDNICPTEEPHKKGSIVGRCLVAIALLAGLSIIFIVSTIILATKLASSRYRNRMCLLQETEMVCISALMNDTEHPIPKPRHPKSNGALIPSTEDEDGDVLTLNSFLPDTECVA